MDTPGEATCLDPTGAPYLTTDEVHGAAGHGLAGCLGRGEVLVRGPNVCAGYYRQPSLTACDFLGTSCKGEHGGGGWLATGDVGVWTAKGELQIVDRLKNLVKLKRWGHSTGLTRPLFSLPLLYTYLGSFFCFLLPLDCLFKSWGETGVSWGAR